MTHSENPGPVTIRDPQVMRAMAHPARLAILDHLAGGHEATATECAEVCGLSPSATSYHLRALAKAGLVEEAPSRGDGRERVWRSAIGGYKVESEDMSTPESLSAALALVDAVLTRDDAHARSFFANATEQPKEWFDAAALTRGRLVMTAAELSELVRAVTELMRPYGRDVRPEPPPGARTVAALFRAIPSPE